MIICILCTDENIAVVRERAKEIPQFASHTALAIPVSETAEMPPSHWFCTFNASDGVYQAIKELQEYTEVEESQPQAFMESRNLKVISLKKMIAYKRARKRAEKH